MYEREPLILTTLKHPIKFIWRFLLMLSVMRWVFAFIAHNIEFLNFIYNFTDKSRFEYNIFFILVVYLTMRLVRSNVEEEMYNPKPKPEPPLMKPDSSFVEEIANAHRARQAQKEAREREHIIRLRWIQCINFIIISLEKLIIMEIHKRKNITQIEQIVINICEYTVSRKNLLAVFYGKIM